MPSNDSTSARAPEHGFVNATHCQSCAEYADELHFTRINSAPATPPSDETPADEIDERIRALHAGADALYRPADPPTELVIDESFAATLRRMAGELATARAPLVDTGGPTAAIYDSCWPSRDVVQTLVDAADHLMKDHDCDQHGWERVGFALKAARAFLATPPSPEGTGTPPTPSELPSQPELGVGVAGELPGVGAAVLTADEIAALRERFASEFDYSAGPISALLFVREIRRLLATVEATQEQVSALRLRAEAAERQMTEASEEIALDDRRLKDFDTLLDMLPCPSHGRCFPYARDLIEAMLATRQPMTR